MVTAKLFSWTFCPGRWSRTGPGGSSSAGRRRSAGGPQSLQETRTQTLLTGSSPWLHGSVAVQTNQPTKTKTRSRLERIKSAQSQSETRPSSGERDHPPVLHRSHQQEAWPWRTHLAGRRRRLIPGSRRPAAPAAPPAPATPPPRSGPPPPPAGGCWRGSYACSSPGRTARPSG